MDLGSLCRSQFVDNPTGLFFTPPDQIMVGVLRKQPSPHLIPVALALVTTAITGIDALETAIAPVQDVQIFSFSYQYNSPPCKSLHHHFLRFQYRSGARRTSFGRVKKKPGLGATKHTNGSNDADWIRYRPYFIATTKEHHIGIHARCG
jgi:hypothetical protein